MSYFQLPSYFQALPWKQPNYFHPTTPSLEGWFGSKGVVWQ